MGNLLALLVMLSPMVGGALEPAHRGVPAPPVPEAPAVVELPSGPDREPTYLYAELTVSNLRFCWAPRCDPADSAYLRGPDGPIPGTDVPFSRILVPPGATIGWNDAEGTETCDLLGCGGHSLRIEDGTPPGRAMGVMMVGGQLRWTVPDDAQPGSIIRYYCGTHAALGMTGAFKVLPVTLTSITVPPAAGVGHPWN